MDSISAELSYISPELQALNLSSATVVFDDQTIIRANKRFLEMFGYELQEVVGRTAAFFGYSTGAGRPQGADGAAGKTGRSETVISRCQRKNGSFIWVKAHCTVVPGPDDAGRLTVAIVSDVTEQQLRAAEERSEIEAVSRSQAVLSLSLDGLVLDANAIFLSSMGYCLDEIVGCHHDVLLPDDAIGTLEQTVLWRDLRQGRHRSVESRHVARDGRDVWLQATFSPILDPSGRPIKIVKHATDVTERMLRQADFEWQMRAIDTSQAVIAFDMNGTILSANQRFLDAVGYAIEEIEGRHHRMFVDPAYAHGSEYEAFWRDLRQGRSRSGQYRRLARDGRDVWLQASYSPVFDMAGRPFKVIKHATVVTDDRLRQADHQGQIAAIHKSQCVVSFALDGTIVDANDNFLNACGYRYSEVFGRHHRMFVLEEDARSDAYKAFWEALGRGEPQIGEFRRRGKDGRDVWLQATYNPIMDMNGRPFKVVKYATDVTAEKLLRADVHGQIEAIHKSQSVIALDLDGTILDANANFLAMIGYAIEDIRGRHHGMLVEPGHAATPEYAEFWSRLRSGRFHSGLYKRIGRDGREVWLQATYNPIFNLDGQPFKVIKFATDVTQNVAMSAAFEDAKRQAQHDAATSLPNRVRLANFMAGALSHAQARLAVLYIDLDRFKPVNDTYGHAAGDRVLGEIADRLRRLVKEDQIVARVGGDEFVIAAPNLCEDAIEQLCRQIISTAEMPIHHDGHELAVTASIGVSLSPADGTTADDLLLKADAALYRSKRDGRATYSFHLPEMHERLAANRHLVDDMRRGIGNGEFYLEYQPRFDTQTHAVRSAEALVRWAHPERGRLAPLGFIELAERSGLIKPLGEFVLDTACRTAVLLPGLGISVNVSPIQFRDPAFVETVARTLAASGLPGERLELEITEGVLMEDADGARSAIAGLKALGVRLAMDDFGTGYSSMSYLCDFPFDVIKIDRRFIADMKADGTGRAVVQAILGLGKALGMSVTAEGVETKAQLAMLTEDRCDEIQGHLLAKSMSASSLVAFIGKSKLKTTLENAA